MLLWSLIPLSCFYFLQIELQFKLRDIGYKFNDYLYVIFYCRPNSREPRKSGQHKPRISSEDGF